MTLLVTQDMRRRALQDDLATTRAIERRLHLNSRPIERTVAALAGAAELAAKHRHFINGAEFGVLDYGAEMNNPLA